MDQFNQIADLTIQMEKEKQCFENQGEHQIIRKSEKNRWILVYVDDQKVEKRLGHRKVQELLVFPQV